MVKVKVVYDYDATQPDELTIKVGDVINDVKKQPGGWWEGVLNGRRGVFPDNFVEDYNEPVPVNQPPKTAKPSSNVQDLRDKIGAGIKVGPPPPKKAGLGKAKQIAAVLFEYKPEQPDELELQEGDEVEITKMEEEGWWEGILRGKRGMFPSNFVKLIETPPPVVTKPAYHPPPENDIGGRKPGGPTGGRPPAEKPKMPAPAPGIDSALPPALPKRSRGVRAKVIYSYHAQNDDELSLEEGQVVTVTDQRLEDPGWWKGELNGKVGVFPDNFVEVINEDEPPKAQTNFRGKPPPQPPVEEPQMLPPRPVAAMPPPHVVVDTRLQQQQHTPPSQKGSLPRTVDTMDTADKPMVNGGMVDDKAVALLREEMEKLKSSMVTRESYELLQRELKQTKDALDTYKKDNNRKLAELMNEIDEVKKQYSQAQVDVNRIKKLAEDHWVKK